MAAKTFGEKKENQEYQLRTGVHGVVFDSKKECVLLVSPPNGSYLLPGGEIEKGENHEQTLRRESIEELGFEVEVGQYLGEAEDYYYSTHREQYYHNPAHFYVISTWKAVAEPLEEDYRMEWVSLHEAKQKLKRGSHQWAIAQYEKQFLDQQNKKMD